MPTGRMNYPRTSTSRSFGRRLVAVAVGAAVTIAMLPGSSLADPAPVELTLDEVRVQVDELHAELETAAETANEARVKAEDVRENLETLRSNLDRLEADLEVASQDAGAFAAAQYRSAGIDPTVQMLLSDDPGDFLARMSQLNSLADRQSRTVDSLASAQALVQQQQLAIGRESERLDELEAMTAEVEAEMATKLQAADALLAQLTAEEKARVEAARLAEERAAAAAAAEAAARSTPATPPSGETVQLPPPPVGDVSGRAAIAVNFAMAQIGKPYSYGGSGPGSYDCSGLTSAAWGAAGVGLPHAASQQRAMGTPISADQLQPGDLVFYYSPIRHVAMYIGGGMIVHASRPGKPIGTAPLYSMPYHSAVRIG